MINNDELIDDYIEYKKISNKSDRDISLKTLDLYRKSLKYLSEFLDKSFKKATEKDLLNYLKKSESKYTRNYRIIIFRSFYKYIFDVDDYQPLPDCIKRIKSSKITKNEVEYSERVVTENEYSRLLNSAGSPIHKAILETLWITGARRNELTNINSDDVVYDGEFTRIKLRKSKKIARTVVYPDRAEHLLLWVEELQPYKGKRKKPLFANDFGSKGVYHRMHYNNSHAFLKRLCESIGMRHITPHDFRHSKCTRMCGEERETDVKTILGLSKDTRMLNIYDHNKLEDYEGRLRERMKDVKPTYPELEKQNEKLVDAQGKEIEDLRKEIENSNRNLGVMLKWIANGFDKNDLKDMMDLMGDYVVNNKLEEK